jgi:hypothetical protein
MRLSRFLMKNQKKIRRSKKMSKFKTFPLKKLVGKLQRNLLLKSQKVTHQCEELLKAEPPSLHLAISLIQTKRAERAERSY